MLGDRPRHISLQCRIIFRTLLTGMVEAAEAVMRQYGPEGKTALLNAGRTAGDENAGMGYRTTEYCADKWRSGRVFYYSNLFAGRRADWRYERALFPLAPECTSAMRIPVWKTTTLPGLNIERCCRKASLKYHVDFEHLHIGEGRG